MDLALALDDQDVDLRSAKVDPGAHRSSLLHEARAMDRT
jgi:hypothetical protein